MKNLIGSAILFLLSITFSFSQVDSIKNSKVVEFGISIGFNFGDLIASNPSEPISIGTIDGINLGILSKVNLSEKLSLIPQANFYLRDSDLGTDSFPIDIDEIQNLGHNEVTIEFPLHISYHPLGEKLGNIGLQFGPRYRYHLGSEDEVIGFNDHQLVADFGLSFDLEFSQFTIRPIISYTRGLSNLVSGERTFDFGSQLKMHSYGLTFQFFG